MNIYTHTHTHTLQHTCTTHDISNHSHSAVDHDTRTMLLHIYIFYISHNPIMHCIVILFLLITCITCTSITCMYTAVPYDDVTCTVDEKKPAVTCTCPSTDHVTLVVKKRTVTLLPNNKNFFTGLTHSLTHSPTLTLCTLTYYSSLTHSSLTHALTHSLTHSSLPMRLLSLALSLPALLCPGSATASLTHTLTDELTAVSALAELQGHFSDPANPVSECVSVCE